ncbi:MAG: sulfatase [Cyclobacteriaceae bacterium]|nr:sulfatase [Cyclobacteriaceae bacterium]
MRYCIWMLVVLLLQACGDSRSDKPNFIIFFVDDMGSQDVEPYGQTLIQTPNISQLAAEGMRWSHAYSSCPVCSPTRVAMLTGKNQARIGFTGHITNIDRHRYPDNSRIIPPDDYMFLPVEEVSLANALKPAGYTSINIGKWHVGGEGFMPEDHGFDYNIAGYSRGAPPSHFYPYENPAQKANPSIPTLSGGSPGEYLTDRLTDEAIAFIKEHKKEPFLVYLPYYAVHTPIEAPDELVEKYKPIVEGSVIDPVYAAMVESVDQNLGRIMQALDDFKLHRKTVLIFTSDNGAIRSLQGDRNIADLGPFREQKGHLYEGGIRVPLIIRWPGVVPAGVVSDHPTITYDIYATIMDIVGSDAKPGSPLDGRSLMADVRGDIIANPYPLYWYYPHYSPRGNKPGAAIRLGDYKLLEFYDPEMVELYNLAEDPGESYNLAGEMPRKRDELLNMLREWLSSTSPIMHTMNPDYEPKIK